MLASALLKMAASPSTRAVTLVDPRREYMLVTDIAWFWSLLPKDFPPLKVGPAIPNRAVKNLLLLAHIGDGDYGRVWLASSLRGVACAVKFPREDAGLSRDSLLHELKVWRDVSGSEASARLQTLNGREALVMPYFQTVPNGGDGADDAVRAAARRAADLMASRGWLHGDLKWGHVGLYRAEGRLEAFFVDLGVCTAVAEGAERDDAARAMKKALGLCEEADG